MECSQRIFPGDHSSTRLVIPSMEQWRGAGPHQCLGEEAVQSQLCSSHRNYDIFRQISRAMMERGQDRDAQQCRAKVKELRNAYRKALEANRRSGFYKELDTILGGDPTSTPKSTMDTSEAVAAQSARQKEESGSEGAEEEGGPEPEDSSASLDACSQELFSSQEEGSQSQRTVLGEEQTAEEVPEATLRSQPSLLSTAERLQSSGSVREEPKRTSCMKSYSSPLLKIKRYRSGGRLKGGSASRMRIAGTKARSSS
ncbi:zinc finger and SCAN domain-containing protein 29-like [Chrysemys picta bellii]|uniref:zinc finger and SCAN domain-containing protein 29-like n=1 Tax=Chrysemys picta bellii TaxID=8478 RepID=UPI0032B2CADD